MPERNERSQRRVTKAHVNWPFEDPPNVATITVRQIVEDGAPILLVVRDSDDGCWQFLTGDVIEIADAMLVGLRGMVEQDPTISELADLEPGWRASRKSVGAEWEREKSEY